MGSGDAIEAPRPIRFMAVNRGIIVGSLYGGVTLVVTLLAFRRSSNEVLAIAAALGFVAGAIVGFSNLRTGSSNRDVGVDATDALMVVVWTAILSVAANLVAIRLAPSSLYPVLGCFSAAALVGSAAGVPVLGFLSRLSVKGRRPFLYIVKATAGIENEDVRFVTRVVLQSLVFAALVALAATVIAVVIGLIILYVIISIFSKDTSRRQRVVIGRSSTEEERTPPEDSREQKHEFIRKPGRVMKEGLLTDTPTGLRVGMDGRVLEEGLLTDRPTGIRVDEGGRVWEEGLLTDTPAGVKLVPDGHGGTKVLKEGLLTDQPAGIRVDEGGRVWKKGLLTDTPAGVKFVPDGHDGDGKKKA